VSYSPLFSLPNFKEDTKKISRKRTRTGEPNPRLLAAKNQAKEAKRMTRELAHTYRRLTPREIAAQYTPEKLAALVEKARRNYQAIAGPVSPGIPEIAKRGMP
jgi:hypothetical protein